MRRRSDYVAAAADTSYDYDYNAIDYGNYSDYSDYVAPMVEAISETVSEAVEEEDSKVIDFIEIMIDRIKRGIESIKKVAENAFNLYEKRTSALEQEISMVSDEIYIQTSALRRYQQEADSVGLSDDLKDKVRSGAIDISEYSGEVADLISEYQTWYEKSLDCADAIEDLSKTLQELVNQKFDMVIQKYSDSLQDMIHAIEAEEGLISRRSAYASDYVKAGESYEAIAKNIESYQKLVNASEIEVAAKEKELIELREQLASAIASGMDESTEGFKAMEQQMYDVENEIDDLYGKIIDYSNEISKGYVDLFDTTSREYDNKMLESKHLANAYSKAMEIAEAQGYLATTGYYNELMSLEEQNIELLQEEYEKLVAIMQAALASGEIEYGSQAWYDMSQKIYAVSEAIQDAKLKTAQYAKSIREVNNEIFDFIQERVSTLTDEANFLIDLLSGKTLVNDRGGFTNEGMATLGMHGMNYNTYMLQADDYGAEAQRMKAMVDASPANKDILERYVELIGKQREFILAAEDEKEAIKDLVKEGIDAEISSLRDLIDEYKDALSAQKELYDFQKNIEEQTKNIASLRKQLSAYENDLTEETQVRVQKIRVELEKAEQNLEETQYEKYLKDQEKLLDALYAEYETILNERLDNMDSLIEDIISTINSNADIVYNTITSASEAVGYTLSDEMNNVWELQAQLIGQENAAMIEQTKQLLDGLVANGKLSQENAQKIIDALSSGDASAVKNALDIVNQLIKSGDLSAEDAKKIIDSVTKSTDRESVLGVYSDNFDQKATTLNQTVNDIKGYAKAMAAAADAQAAAQIEAIKAEQEAKAEAERQALEEAKKAESTKEAAKEAANKTASTATLNPDGTVKKDSVADEVKKPSNGSSSSSSNANASSSASSSSSSTPNRSEKEYYGVALAIWNGNHGWGSGNERKRKLEEKGFDYNHTQAIVNQMGIDGLVPGVAWIGHYYGIRELQPYAYNSYASGARRVGRNTLGWTNENWNTIGGETIVRRSDHAVLTPLGANDSVYNALASSNLWSMANNPSAFIAQNMPGLVASGRSSSGYGTVVNNLKNLTFNLPNVQNYEDFVTKMKNDKKFETLVQNMTIGAMMGRNEKQKINW